MTETDHRPRRRRRWPWLLLAAVAGIALVAAGLWRAFDADLVYRFIQPREARLLEGHRIPQAPSAADLVADLHFLGEQLPRRHADFAEAFDPAAFRALLARLTAAAPGMTPEQRQMAILQGLASGGPGTGHTLVVPLQRALDWRHYGLAFFDFADGVYVVAAGAWQAELTGARVLAVGGVEIGEALARLAPCVSADNEWSRRFRTFRLLSLAEPLMAVGLADRDGRATFTLDSGDGPRDVVVEPSRLASLEGLAWGLRMLQGVEGVWSPADPRQRRPSYRVGEGAKGLQEPAEGVMVLRLDALSNGSDGSPGRFVAAAVRAAGARPAASPLRRFVLDLRSDGGGDNQLAPAVVDAIAGDPVVDRRGVLYVLIGRRTFSAAGNLAAALERRTRAIFAGEPSGSAPAQWGDSVPLLLPRTGIVVRLATRRWLDDLPGVRRTTIEPDLEIPLTSGEHFGGTDPAIAAVLAHRVAEPAAEPGAPTDLPAAVLGNWLATPLHRVTLRAEPPRLEISTGQPFAESDLQPLAAGRWTTDIRDVELLTAGEGAAPVLRWKGRDFPLQRVPEDWRLPRELLGDPDAHPPVAPDADAAVAAYRAAAREVEIDSDDELAINRAGYRLLRGGDAGAAVTLFRLNTELFSVSANTWDSLGDGFRAAGDLAAARTAYRHALAVDPTYDHARGQLTALGR